MQVAGDGDWHDGKSNSGVLLHLYFANQERNVWLLEAQTWSWNTMMFDVRGYVFVVRMRACQKRFIWMRLRIIPVKQVFTLPDLMAIASDCAR